MFTTETIQLDDDFIEISKWQIQEINQAIIEADNDEFAKEEMIDSVLKKWRT